MSGEGLGAFIALPLIIGAGGVVLAGAAILLAGAAVVGLVAGAIELGARIHDAYKAREERRRAELREALSEMDGKLAEEAVHRHDAMAKAAEAADESSEALRAERLAAIEKLGDELKATDISNAAMITRVAEFLAEEERTAEERVDRQIEAFEKEVTAASDACTKRISDRIERDTAVLSARITSVEEQERRYREYAQSAYRDASDLQEILCKKYDVEALRLSGELSRLLITREMLERSISRGDWSNAANHAGMMSSQVQLLHVHLELNQTLLASLQEKMERAAADLTQDIEMTKNLLDEDTDEQIAYYVDEECDADFWSEGTLSPKWKEAQALIEELKSFTLWDKEKARRLLTEASKLHTDISKAFIRARQHVLSRLAMEDAMGKIIESMEESGWEPSTEAEYVKLDKATGAYEKTDDPRGFMMLHFERSGDERTIVFQSQYDEESGVYQLRIVRYCNEMGTVDESERAEDDMALQKALVARMNLPANAAPTCNASTRGIKRRV